MCHFNTIHISKGLAFDNYSELFGCDTREYRYGTARENRYGTGTIRPANFLKIGFWISSTYNRIFQWFRFFLS